MKSSLFTRVFAGFGLITVALAVVLSVVSLRSVRTFYIDSLRTDLHRLAQALADRLAGEMAGGAPVDSLVKAMGATLETRVTVVAPDGSVLGDSEEDPALMENHRARPEILKAFSGERGSSLRYSETVKTDMLYVAVPVRQDGTVSGVVRVSLFLHDIEDLLSSIRRVVAVTVFITLLVSLLGTLLVTRSISRPINALRDASARIAAGDFRARVDIRQDNEFRELAGSFNYMSSEIRSLVGALSRQKEELNAIITSLSEGLILLDGEGRIALHNPAFRTMSGLEAPEGKLYWQVIGDPAFTSFVKDGLAARTSTRGELELGGRVYLCSLAVLVARGTAVVIFHDITEIQRMERVKKEFVTNVSHELNTPLTAIKGFVETLEDEVTPGQRHYVEVINRHTERLINIVKDLLRLSELEDRETELQMEDVSLEELVDDVVQIFAPRAAEKGIRLDTDIPAGLPPVRGDAFRLQQVFVNLVDNAVKYSEQGTVSIAASAAGDAVHAEVRDTGIGIPVEHAGRIFERFYVVDKSRSRQSGGTGLGLSIVKHIIAQHGGTIEVKSRPGEGTVFRMTLPVGNRRFE